MTFKEAMELAEQGKRVRHDEMSIGWVVALDNGKLRIINEATNSSYNFTFSKPHGEADWYVAREGWTTYG